MAVKKQKRKMNMTLLLALGFFGVIIIGMLLLMLPISSKSGEITPMSNALFTATSATCVTGLVMYDTFTHWSIFGQIVIIIMIQIGGIGLMTIVAQFFSLLKKNITLSERKLFQESSGSPQIGGTFPLIKKVLVGTFIFEALGAVVLSLRFCPAFGLGKGIYYGIFHSISAFCNAGFDLMGTLEADSSLTRFNNDPVVLITIMLLIIIGGLGFFVWSDVFVNRFNLTKIRVHSKIVLAVTAFVLLTSTLIILLPEINNAFKNMSAGDSVLNAAFQAVTCRTAGYFSVPYSEFSEPSKMISILLMMIGGNTGSTAGGIKITTIAVIIAGTISTMRGSSQSVLFKRRMEDGLVRKATAIASIYIFLIVAATFVISIVDNFSVLDTMYEITSAICTVGLSSGITTQYSLLSKLIVIVLMFVGRIGGLSMVMIIAQKKNTAPLNRPVEKILIG